jgi:hypothetical protein
MNAEKLRDAQRRWSLETLRRIYEADITRDWSRQLSLRLDALAVLSSSS